MRKIRASKCEIREVSVNEEREFLNENHKQGYVGSEYAIGLYYENELVQIETFGAPRIEIQNKAIKHDWELLRECSKKDYQIYGGKSRLLKRFENEKHPLSLLSYCSLTEGFDGHSYIACGFTEINRSVSYHYEKNGEKILRYKMQKNANLRNAGKKENIQKTIESFGGTYNPNETERENAKRNGFVMVSDKGNITFEKNYSDFRGYVYKTTNLLNGKIYIGQHVPTDSSSYIGSGKLLKKAQKKYGKKSFKIEVLQWCHSREELNEAEVDWINNTPECLAENGTGYNIKTTEQSVVDYSWTKDGEKSKIWKEKLSIANTGKHHTDEAKQKISVAVKNGWSKLSKEEKSERAKIASAIAHSDNDTSKFRHTNGYDDNWKEYVSTQTKKAVAKSKEATIEYIHSLGYRTREDLMKEYGLSYKQVRTRFPQEVGCYKKIKYY